MIQALGDVEANIQASLLKIFNPSDSIGSEYFYVKNISHPLLLQWPHLKEKIGQHKHAFHIMVVAVFVFNFQT